MAIIRRRAKKTAHPENLDPIVHLWILRILFPLGCVRDFISLHGFSNDTLAALLGLGDWIDPPLDDFKPKSARLELRRLHQAVELEFANAAPPRCLEKNVAQLANLVGLSAEDCRILEFTILLQSERLL